MKRDAIPGHEVDRMVDRLKAGEPLEVIQDSLKDSVSEGWFERNADSLYAFAGLERPAQQNLSLDDVLDEPEPTEAKVAVDEVEHEGEPLSEAERAAAREELAKLEEQARAADPAPEQKGKKHRK